MYVCEDCGHTTSDPEGHFTHLQQNHPFCPALTRCHDKRQFKFKGDNSDEYDDKSTIDTSEMTSDETSGSMEDATTSTHAHAEATSQIVLHRTVFDNDRTDRLQVPTPTNRTDRLQVPTPTITSSSYVSESPVTLKHEHTDTLRQSNETMVETPPASDTQTHVVQSSRPISSYSHTQSVIYHTDRLPTKRHSDVISATSPLKKQRTLNSPKKSKPTSPMKVRPQSSNVSENGTIPIPKFDLEHLSAKTFSDHPVKKRPLGSLTQNTIHQLNVKNNEISQNKQTSLQLKMPLGSIIENNQW